MSEKAPKQDINLDMLIEKTVSGYFDHQPEAISAPEVKSAQFDYVSPEERQKAIASVPVKRFELK